MNNITKADVKHEMKYTANVIKTIKAEIRAELSDKHCDTTALMELVSDLCWNIGQRDLLQQMLDNVFGVVEE